MTQGDIAAGIRRLRQLAKGLVQDAVAAVENARVGLERVLERLRQTEGLRFPRRLGEPG